MGTYDEVVTWDESSLERVSRRYIICTDKPSPARERFLARVDELLDAALIVDALPTGHFPMQSTPKALTALLLPSAVAVRSESSVVESA